MLRALWNWLRPTPSIWATPTPTTSALSLDIHEHLTPTAGQVDLTGRTSEHPR